MDNRIRKLVKGKKDSREYVLYWMQASVRTKENLALNYAIEKANEYNLPVVVYFRLVGNYPEANLRHYQFLIEGLKEVHKELTELGIKFVVDQSNNWDKLGQLAEKAQMLVDDRGYLKIQRQWYKEVKNLVDCPYHQIEDNVVVPVEMASNKEEYAAWTLRKKINPEIGNWLKLNLSRPEIRHRIDNLPKFEVDIDKLNLDTSITPVKTFIGGTKNAKRLFKDFFENKIDKYNELRNHPELDYQSQMSPYLHFGQISPIWLAKQVWQTNSPGKEDFWEELIIRRELAINFVYYNPDYNNFNCLPDWAKKTLDKHAKDKRPVIYSRSQLENAKTNDKYWNAAQMEMVKTGKMHNYMRMYWGKKILEWTKTPEKDFQICLDLNNKYELDGRDPNSYAGVAWIFGKHDRPWQERPIFGTTRYMTSSGLERKFDMEMYVDKVGKS